MPKMKTRKCAIKRFKITGNGDFVHNCTGKRHILTKKSSKRKNRLSKSKMISSVELKKIKRSIPYYLNSI